MIEIKINLIYIFFQERCNELFQDDHDISSEEIELLNLDKENNVGLEASENEKLASSHMESVREKRTFAQSPLAQTPPSASTNKKARTIRQEDVVNKHLRHATEVLGSLRGKQQSRQVDPDTCTLYGQLLAAKLRKLSKRNRIILQNKIDNLVYEAELNELEYSPSPPCSQVSGSPNCTLSSISPNVAEETMSTYYVSASDLLQLTTNNDDDSINK